MLEWAAAAVLELTDLDSSEETLSALKKRQDELAALVSAAGSALSAERVTAAARLSELASGELDNLAMGRARLRIAVSSRMSRLITMTRSRSARIGCWPVRTDWIR